MGNFQGRATCFTTLWLCGGGGGRAWKGDSAATWLLAGCLALTVSTHFIYSPYATSVLPVVALVNSKGTGSVCVLGPCGPFKQSLLKIQHFLPPPQPPLVFRVKSYRDLSSGDGSLGCVVWLRAGVACCQDTPPDFYLPHVCGGRGGLPILLPLLATPHLHPSTPSG